MKKRGLVKVSDDKKRVRAQSKTITHLRITLAEMQGKISDLEIELTREKKIFRIEWDPPPPLTAKEIAETEDGLGRVSRSKLILECFRRGITKQDFFDELELE